MIELTAEKIVLCLLVALMTVAVIKFMLGRRHAEWFTLKPRRSLLAARSCFSRIFAMGSPKTAAGYAVTLILLLIILSECLLILFLV